MSAPEAAFWSFSLEIYALPEVAKMALRLQDREGKDVNLILYCLYAGMVLGLSLDEMAFQTLSAAVRPWSDCVIAPLREARRRSKTFDLDDQAKIFRSKLQNLELDAERLAQRRIITAMPPGADAAQGSLDLARKNLLLYAGDVAQPLWAALRDGLAVN